MHGLQSVAHIGQGAADDHRHGVVEIRPLHLLFNVDGLNVQRAGAVAAGRRSEREFRILIVWHSLALSCQLSTVSSKTRGPNSSGKPVSDCIYRMLCAIGY